MILFLCLLFSFILDLDKKYQTFERVVCHDISKHLWSSSKILMCCMLYFQVSLFCVWKCDETLLQHHYKYSPFAEMPVHWRLPTATQRCWLVLKLRPPESRSKCTTLEGWKTLNCLIDQTRGVGSRQACRLEVNSFFSPFKWAIENSFFRLKLFQDEIKILLR